MARCRHASGPTRAEAARLPAMLNEFIAGLAVLVTGGILGGFVTYVVKPPLDAWLERRAQTRKLLTERMLHEERASEAKQASRKSLVDFRARVVRELQSLKILDMARPLDLEETYVQLSIQEQQARRYSDRHEADESGRRDPNTQLDLRQERLGEERGKTFAPEEALRRFRHMVVLGDPGAGKTTMLKYVCLLAAKGKGSGLPDFPIFITLNRFAKEEGVDLLDFIVAETSHRYGLKSGRSFVEECLDDGSALLLLDGLDETSVGSAEQADEAYRHTVGEINKLSTRFPKAPVIVTSRRAGWRGQLSPTFSVAEVLDFSANDVRQFVENWFGRKSEQARNLQLRLSEQAQLQELAANPLLLSLIAIVFEQDLELPERRAKLYERCVHVLLTEWDAHRGIKRQSLFTADRKRDLLEDVALHFHHRGHRYFSKDALLEVVSSYLPTIDLEASQAEAILEEITDQHGLLKEQAIDWYGFLHLTLQEYFSALSIDRAGRLELALANANNPWWEEVILLLAGMSKDASPLLHAILAETDDIFHSRLILAGRCLAGTPRISEPDLRRQIAERLRSTIRDETIHWLPRTHAVRALQEADRHHGADYLLAVLFDLSVQLEVRVAAVDALKWTADPSVPHRLLDVMVDEQHDLELREWIASTMIEVCRPTLVPRLVQIVRDESIASEVRSECARAVGHWGDEEAIPPLLDLLVESNDGGVAWRTARALCELRAFQNPGRLRKLTGSQQIHRFGRWAIAKGVENLEMKDHPQVLEWIADSSLEPQYRWNFAKWLGRCPVEAQTVRGLQQLFKDSRVPPSVRACVGTSLLLLAIDEPMAQLKAYLDADEIDPYVKKKTAEVLVECGERDISKSLLTVLKTDLPPRTSFVRLRMAELLASIGDPTMVPELFSVLGDESIPAHIRRRAADALATFDTERIAEAVAAFVLDGQRPLSVRARAVHCLPANHDTIRRLVDWIDRQDIGDEAYLALHRTSRRCGVRILKKAGAYTVEAAATA